jgi:hypothetical protein
VSYYATLSGDLSSLGHLAVQLRHPEENPYILCIRDQLEAEDGGTLRWVDDGEAETSGGFVWDLREALEKGADSSSTILHQLLDRCADSGLVFRAWCAGNSADDFQKVAGLSGFDEALAETLRRASAWQVQARLQTIRSSVRLPMSSAPQSARTTSARLMAVVAATFALAALAGYEARELLSLESGFSFLLLLLGLSLLARLPGSRSISQASYTIFAVLGVIGSLYNAFVTLAVPPPPANGMLLLAGSVTYTGGVVAIALWLRGSEARLLLDRAKEP